MVTEAQVREALRSVLDPEIGRPIEDIGMLRGISIEGDTVRVDVLITIEGCPLKDRITNDVTAAVDAARGRGARGGRPLPHVAGAARGARATAAWRRRGGSATQSKISFPAVHGDRRDRVRQGRRRQVERHREPRVRPRRRGTPRRRPGRGRVGVQHPADARRPGQARRLQRHDPAARGSRREGDLDGVLRPRGDAGDLARTHAPQGDRAVPGRRLLGRPGLPALRPARRGPATCPSRWRRSSRARRCWS